ncbi:MAG: hydantoinase/oxoprolinase family protein [Alphaproteobacteria bacterium]|jgi:N-methylhydantoinase A|nr:hydantoinase/oxoprolinase family protein [Alphaproteobacteria bacterium]
MRGREKTNGADYRLAIDVGGTFIDFVLLDERTGEVVIDKEPSSSEPSRLSRNVLEGVGRLPVGAGDIARLFHGMTIGINTLVQENGARVGLITTRGFRDVLEIGRGSRKEIYNYFYRGPAPLVERFLRREVPERLNRAGEVVIPLDLDRLNEEAAYLVKQGVDAVAIVFLHAYANPAHERAAKAHVAQMYPDLAVTASHEVASEWREYERTSTAVMNGYIQSLVGKYLNDLSGRLVDVGYKRPVAIMQSNGGVCSAETASEKPIRTLMSGPAGGVIGAKALASELGYDNVICADVGGTSYDVALIENGRILERTETSIAKRPILGTLIDITSIGAGGGSLAWIDQRGGLRVGPQSAGARPGPVCFGFGGSDPTVTDCHLVLGRLDADNFLGSRMKLDIAAARAAIENRIARPLDLDLEEAASGILAIAETSMTYAIRTKTVERGLDPREFTLLSYGGGGGLFAAATGEELDVKSVIIPRFPANFSAWGLLTSDYLEDASVTRVQAFTPESALLLTETLGDLERQTAAAVSGYGFASHETEQHYRLDVRFAGQEYTISVDVDPDWLSDVQTLLSGVQERFVAAHRQLYGHGDADAPLEIVTARCRTTGKVKKPRPEALKAGEPGAPRSCRPVYFRGAADYLETGIFEREKLSSGQVLEGPAIVEEWTTTTVVPPGWRLGVDGMGNLIMDRG